MEQNMEEEDDPLKTEGGGQQPIEVVQEVKRQNRQQQKLQRRAHNDYLYDDATDDDDDNDDDDDDDAGYSDDSTDDGLRRPESLSLPELSYVITVQDDLYRRLVEEISSKKYPPIWGYNQETGRADIRLALIILFFVMLLLGMGSLEWPTE